MRLAGIVAAQLALVPASWADCLDSKNLKALDYRYEQALRVGDREFLEELLAEDFVWIHNHAVQQETRRQLLERLGGDYQPLKAREQSDVQVRRLGQAAVIHGFTTVEQFTADDSRRANRYHFLRTYIATDQGCRLLAGQTMKTWSTEGAVD